VLSLPKQLGLFDAPARTFPTCSTARCLIFRTFPLSALGAECYFAGNLSNSGFSKSSVRQQDAPDDFPPRSSW